MKMRWLFWVFLVVGLGALWGSWALYGSTKSFLKTAQTTNGIVVDLIRKSSNDSNGTSYTYYPVVMFQPPRGQSIQFESNFGSNPPSYNKGDVVEVLFNPKDFKSARINSFGALWMGALICGFIGLVFSFIGGGVIWYDAKKKATQDLLKVIGQRVATEFADVKQKNYEVNGQSPWVVMSKWKNPQTGETHIFESDNIWFDPRDYLENRKTLDVLIDPSNPKKHYMDVSFLPRGM